MSIPRGIRVTGVVRSVGVNQNQKPFLQLEIPSRQGVELIKVGVKTNGQKLNEEFSCQVSPNVFNGQFYGFSEI